MLYNFENLYILISFIVLFLVFNIIGDIKKKAFFPMVTLIFSVASLIVHYLSRSNLQDTFLFNTDIDFILIAVSITNLLIIDEIETRRIVIKEVFENRYSKKK